MRIVSLVELFILCQIDFFKYVYFYQLEGYNLLNFYKKIYTRFDYIDLVSFVINLVFLITDILFDNETIMIIFCALFLVTIVIKLSKLLIKFNKSKVKYVHTKRMIRLHLMYALLELLTIIFMILSKTCKFSLLYLVNFITYSFVVFIMLPIEKCICDRYIAKARKKISDMKHLKIIAITGSYGKTSVKNILFELLSQKYNVCMTPSSYNTPMGICKCILNNLEPYHEILILEFGAKKVGEIKYLCEKFSPDFGVITSIGPQHIKSFKSIGNIVKTKMELYEFIPDKSNLFLNCSNSYIIDYLLKSKNGQNCNVVIDDISNLNNNHMLFDSDNIYQFGDISVSSRGSTFEFKYNRCGKSVVNTFSTCLLGKHNVTNIALSISVALRFGLSEGQIACGLSNLKSIRHRLELKSVGDYIVIDNAYNSNPDSFKCAIEVLCLFSNSHKIVVTPGVIDQGDNLYKENYNLGKYMASRVDLVYVVNKTNRDAIVSGLIAENFANDSIVVCDKFSDVDFNKFSKGDVVLIENDLPDNFD